MPDPKHNTIRRPFQFGISSLMVLVAAAAFVLFLIPHDLIRIVIGFVYFLQHDEGGLGALCFGFAVVVLSLVSSVCNMFSTLDIKRVDSPTDQVLKHRDSSQGNEPND